MKTGKCPESVLKRSVFKQLKKRRKDVLCRPGIGKGGAVISGILSNEDGQRCLNGRTAADLDADGQGSEPVLVTHTEAFYGTPEEIAYAAVHSAAAALLIKGAVPAGIEVAVLMPLGYEESQLRQLMQLLDQCCDTYGMEVVGGHTEYMPSVQTLTVSVTAFGFADRKDCMALVGPKPGDDIVMTKWAGYYGTAVIAKRGSDVLKTRFYPDFINETDDYLTNLSVQREIEIARQFDATVMYGIAKGGIFGALWEVAVAGKVGLLVDLKKIPLKQQTVEICNYYDINPYKLSGYGALLIAAPQGEHLVAALEKEGIAAAVIGQFNDTNDRVVVNDDETRFLEPVRDSEAWQNFDNGGIQS